MIAKLTAWLKAWWTNHKGVIEDFVLPKLDGAIVPLKDFLIDRGLSLEIADTLSHEIIAWIKMYLKRQL